MHCYQSRMPYDAGHRSIKFTDNGLNREVLLYTDFT